MHNPALHHIDAVKALAIQAGKAIMQYHANGYDITKKQDGSPVTLADQASEDIVIDGLEDLTPDIPVIAEEQIEAGNMPERFDPNGTFWLVDPLDGTKEFIRGTNDFTVNIGLIHEGNPVMGVVYLPATQDIYYGGEGLGAFFNDQPIHIRDYDAEEGLTMVGTWHHPDPEKGRQRAEMLSKFKIAGFTKRGSSLKFCMVADGQAHLYIRHVPTYEWDTAAAHALLLQVGGDIVDMESRQRLTYGKQDHNFLNPYIITGTDEILGLL